MVKKFDVVFARQLPNAARELQLEKRGKNLGRRKNAFQFLYHLVDVSRLVGLEEA